MTTETTLITETNNFIILDKYTKIEQPNLGYQTEADLEREFIADLQTFNYEYRTDITTPERLLSNTREQLQQLNNISFLD
ncbi:hypothetical protein NUS61_10890, partial [Glaesserella parasuis]|nr:hypothetical protein [Glaesserella parasuis]